MLLLQLEVVEPGTTLAAFPVKVPDELVDRDAPVQRGVATVEEFLDGAIPPRGSPHPHVHERRHGDPRRRARRVLVRQDPVLHAPEPAIADKLQRRQGTEHQASATMHQLDPEHNQTFIGE